MQEEKTHLCSDYWASRRSRACRRRRVRLVESRCRVRGWPSTAYSRGRSPAAVPADRAVTKYLTRLEARGALIPGAAETLLDKVLGHNGATLETRPSLADPKRPARRPRQTRRPIAPPASQPARSDSDRPDVIQRLAELLHDVEPVEHVDRLPEPLGDHLEVRLPQVAAHVPHLTAGRLSEAIQAGPQACFGTLLGHGQWPPRPRADVVNERQVRAPTMPQSGTNSNCLSPRRSYAGPRRPHPERNGWPFFRGSSCTTKAGPSSRSSRRASR